MATVKLESDVAYANAVREGVENATAHAFVSFILGIQEITPRAHRAGDLFQCPD